MKQVLALAFSMLMSLPAFAEHVDVKEIFLKNPTVQGAITAAKEQKMEVVDTVGVALLAGGCGWAGCDYAYLVTLPVRTTGANPQTSVIAAVVTQPALRDAKVKMVDADALLLSIGD